MDWQDRITLNPKVLVGKPVIKGTRLAVEFIIDLFAQGWSIDEVLRNYPGIAIADIQACFACVSAFLKAEKISTAIAFFEVKSKHVNLYAFQLRLQTITT
jgi:uncharacterized protein (DUF433 family)